MTFGFYLLCGESRNFFFPLEKADHSCLGSPKYPFLQWALEEGESYFPVWTTFGGYKAHEVWELGTPSPSHKEIQEKWRRKALPGFSQIEFCPFHWTIESVTLLFTSCQDIFIEMWRSYLLPWKSGHFWTLLIFFHLLLSI